ncbi:MAG: DUF4386 domain-containing protein [Bryobacteraceae bacterium]
MSRLVMKQPIIEMSPKLKARIAGLLYLTVIVFGAFAELGVRARLVAPGDPAVTAQNIMAHQTLYRLGFAAEVFYLACNVPLTVIFYGLFKVVNQKVALLEAIFGLVSTAVEAVSLLAHYAPIVILGGASYLSAFTPTQLQEASYVSLQLFEGGFAICLVFFAFDCFAMAYLIVNSTFFPRIIGVALAIEGVGYFINSFTLFLAPVLQTRIFPYFTVTALAEVSLALWLLVMGVNEPRWREQARAAGLSA